MSAEPERKRVIAFVDGQNLFHSARQVFNHRTPNYRFTGLAKAVCSLRIAEGWELSQTRFYTGIPNPKGGGPNAERWRSFWAAKLLAMKRRDVEVYSRPLQYSRQKISLSDGTTIEAPVGREKGIDVRIAVDVIRLALRCEYDVALLFSRDQDLSEVAQEIRAIAREQRRWLRIASAFPRAEGCGHNGIAGTEPIRILRNLYNAHIDSAS